LELFEELHKYCEAKGYINFEFHPRLSQEGVNPARWDENFVLNEMKKYHANEVNRVWVCGPPVMNETFDRAFDTETFRNLEFKREQFEIL